MKRRLIAAFLCCLVIGGVLSPLSVRAAEQEAQSISIKKALTETKGFPSQGFLYDGEMTKAIGSEASASLTLTHSEGIGSLYILYQYIYGRYTVVNNDTGAEFTAGRQEFYHEFIDLQEIFGQAPSSVTIRYDRDGVYICELLAYTPGAVPDSVQRWEAPLDGRTDLILFSTHGDDEQLFFAGILPYYAKALGYQVQVVYLTDHRKGTNPTNTRIHEMLNGLWAVGCTTYPVFGTFPDFIFEDIKSTYAEFEKRGVTREDILEFCVAQLRRFKPKVIVTHDFAGEYKHGQHMVYADCVAEALEAAADPARFPHLAEEYGSWNTPKAYFHLYEQNQIVMDWDTPMEALGGLSPFQVTQKYGFPCHKSQLWTWFSGWINGKNGVTITRADQIRTHNPCYYGLYRSTVGQDVAKKDFFENVTTYAQDYESYLAQNPQPPETAPSQTVPPPTDPVPQSTPAATTSPASTPAATQPPVSQPKPVLNDDVLHLMIALAVLCLLLAALFFLMGLRDKKRR